MSVSGGDRLGPFLRADESKAVDNWFSREERYALGTDLLTGRCFLSFPVNASAFGYEEYYEVDPEISARYLADPALAFDLRRGVPPPRARQPAHRGTGLEPRHPVLSPPAGRLALEHHSRRI